MQVEIWSDVVCPWCYLGKVRFEKALSEFVHRDEVSVRHRSFQLDPGAPSDSTVDTSSSLAAKYGLTPERVDAMQREMEARAASDGLEYHLDGQRTGNTHTAHRLLQLAADQGRQDELLERMYRAYFTEHGSVFDADALRGLALESGLAQGDVDRVLAGDAYADAVEADLEQAHAYGITGVPFYVIDGRFGISGAQPVEVFSAALEQAHAAASSATP
ncbi:MAG TPA: DsbA family oxidoreductase [Jatrophihabitantaceae bacterium]